MKKEKSNNENLTPLDMYIAVVQIMNESDKIEEKLRRSERKYALRTPVLIGPILMLFGGFVFELLPLLILGIFITVGGVGYFTFSEIKELVSMYRKATDIPEDPQEFSEMLEEEIKMLDEMLDEDEIELKDGKEFYTETAKTVISSPVSEDRKKYNKVLFNQKSKKISSDPVEETMYKISEELYAYSKIYRMPSVNIDERLWKSLFDNMYNVFSSKGLECDYYKYMADLSRMVYARAIVDNKEINVVSFLDELFVSYSVSKEDIKNVLRRMKDLQHVKVLNFNSFRK